MVIVFGAAVEVAAGIVAVMATQALAVGGADEGVVLHPTVLEGKMAGSASGGVTDGGVPVALRVDMAAKAATAKHVIGQVKGRGQGFAGRDVGWRSEWFLGTEMTTDGVDLVGQGEVEGGSGRFDLLWMATAAGRSHLLRVAWPGDEAGMRPLLVAFLVDTPVTGCAGQLMGCIEEDVGMTARAPRHRRSRRHLWFSRRGRGWLLGGLLVPAAAEQQEKGQADGERSIHNLDIIP